MTVNTSVEPRVAILQNSVSKHATTGSINTSITARIHASCPAAQISVFKPIEGEPFPDLTGFALVILTGGVYNLLSDDPQPPWVQDTLSFVRQAASAAESSPKVLGICWGHQAISFALGGGLEYVATGPRIGVETISLTLEGKKFFSLGDTLNIHKFHRRRVATPGRGLVPLAENNEILTASSGKILSFQGHPELTDSISAALVARGDAAYTNTEAACTSLNSNDAPHDGEEIFKHICAWALPCAGESMST